MLRRPPRSKRTDTLFPYTTIYNPQTGGGALSAEAVRKIVDFTVMCDSFNIPLVRLMDTPGFVVGTDAERRGAPGHIMNFMNATCLTTVPQVTVICRKAYGRAYVAMGGGAHNDAMIAWPIAARKSPRLNSLH